VLDGAPPRFALAALSMGGYVAFAVMRAAPERVTRLCLMDTSARPDTAEQSRKRRAFMAMSRANRFRGVTPRLLPQLVHPDRLDDAALTDEIMAMADRVGLDAFLRQQTAILGRPDSRPGLPLIKVPTVALVGSHDALTPPHLAAEIANCVPGGHFQIIREAGHMSPMERPAAVSDCLGNWLGRESLFPDRSCVGPSPGPSEDEVSPQP
jgi:pimeloyl-ACP methyl ester carboxylesterase